MSSQSPKNRGTSVFRRKDAPIAPGNGFDHNKKRMNRSNPLPAPGRSIDAPGINLDYNKKRNNWSSSSAAPGAFSAFVGSSPAPGRTHMSTRAPGTHFDHNKKRTNESNSAPGGFGATGTDPDYNKKRKNWSGNQRNQVPHHRNHNTGYNHNRNSGPNNCVHSEYTADARNGDRGYQHNQNHNDGSHRGYQSQNKHRSNQRRHQPATQDQDVDMDRPLNNHQGQRNSNRSPRNYDQRNFPQQNQNYNRQNQKYNRGNSVWGNRQNYNNIPNKFQSTFHDVDPDIDMQDAPSDEQNDIEMVDAPPLIPDNDPRIKAFTQGVHALQHIVHSMVNVAAQIDTSILQNEYCTA